MKEQSGISKHTEERPLVTFALFAYNQEKYIREAVEGAFSQTYEPLEIILSDDCSSDRSFEIMQEMAKAYCGTKKVIVRKTKKNRGTLLHVVEVAKLAKGELIILAAGDDISKPHRTESLVCVWQSSGAWGLCSRFDRIDEEGCVIVTDDTVKILSSPRYALRQYFSTRHDEVKIIHGATSAYDKKLFDFLDTLPEDYILSEDGVLSVLLNLLNKEICILDTSLVLYRENDQSLTNGVKSKNITYKKTHNDEKSIERFARSQANRCQLFLRLNEKYGQSSFIPLDDDRIRKEIQKQRIRECWYSVNLKEKMKYLLNIREVADLKWSLPRLLPRPVFIAAKTFFKVIISRR